jgi:hypothetical protein
VRRLLRVRTTITMALCAVLYASSGTTATAVCTGASVGTFGAKGDGHSDDTTAIQSAINAAGAAGGGSVVFNVARYFTTGTIQVPAGVVLCGPTEGPFDVAGSNPGTTTIAPTLLVTNSSGPFITLQGIGAGVTDLLFHYPNQVDPTASAPNVYPYTIVAAAPGTKVVRSATSNAYNFLDIESGRVIAQDLFIGAYNIGINIDHAHDHVTVRNVLNQVFWEAWQPTPYPLPIDTWVQSHGIALVVNRADSLEIHDLKLFSRYAGMLLTDSPDTSQSPRCGFGTGSDINFDTVQYGIIVTASNTAGYEFANVIIGSGNGGVAALQLQGGGSLPPNVLINGGSQRGNWSLGPFPAPVAGNQKVLNIIGFDLP